MHSLSGSIATEARLERRLIQSSAELDALGADWNELTREQPFCSSTWMHSWWQEFETPAEQLFSLALHDPEGSLVGLAPWYLRHMSGRARTLHFLGSGRREVGSDFLTMPVRPGYEKLLAGQMVDWLCGEAARSWDIIELSAVEPHDPVAELLCAGMAERGCWIHRKPDVTCWRLELPSSWDALLSSLSKNRRQRLRMWDRRHLASGRMQVHMVQTPEELDSLFPVLVDLHRRRRDSVSQSNSFNSSRYERFHRIATRRLLEQGQLRLMWLEWEGRPIAIQYGFTAGETVYYYQSGLEPEVAAERPGWLMMMASIRRAIEDGQRVFEFLRGDEPYKQSWRAVPVPLMQLRIVNQNVRARLWHTAWRTETALRRVARRAINFGQHCQQGLRRVARSRVQPEEATEEM